MTALNHEYSKVISEGLRVAGSFIYILRSSDGSGSIDQTYNSIVEPLFYSIKEKL